MASTVFVNGSTLTDEDWFNDVNRLQYTIFGDPANDAAAATGIGLGTGDSPTFTDVTATGQLVGKSATATPAGGSAAGVLIGSASIGIYWGSGVPTASASKGSLYLRTDGSSSSTRAYINTDGGTTWTALTTAA